MNIKGLCAGALILLFLQPLFVTAEIADRTAYLSDFAARAAIKWPDNRTMTIVCHGHSVPAGYFNGNLVRTFDSYPHLAHVELSRRFSYAVINVIVTAIGGENSERGAARFARDVLALNPDVVTIDYALNDRRIGLERAEKAWRSMIEAALAANIKVILLTPTGHLKADFNNPNEPLNQHAGQIRKLAGEYGVGLADSWLEFEKAAKTQGGLTAYMSQTNHPNRKGHELVAAQLVQWFPSSMEK